MEDDLWFMQQQSRVLQEFRAAIRPLWNDSAAREIDARYLDVHADEDRTMVKAFGDEAAVIGRLSAHLESAYGFLTKIEEMSQCVREHLDLSGQEVNAAYQTYEQYLQYTSVAQSLFREVASWIAEANTVCEGVPTK